LAEVRAWLSETLPIDCHHFSARRLGGKWARHRRHFSWGALRGYARAAEAKALRVQVKDAQEKLRAQRDYKKKLAEEKKKLKDIKPPPDIKLPTPKRKHEDVEEDEEDEDEEEEDEDEVEGFAKSLRAYMDRYVVESLDSYRRDARKAAIDAADREGTFAETIPVPPPPPKVKPKAEDVRARSGPAIFFA
jgi:hypothetical protein